MTTFSPVITPSRISRTDAFSARQYSRKAFANLIDPVLNVDWFEMAGPTFPPHPHAGFSAVTYVFADSPNGFVNRDSLGEEHIIAPGGLHWSRASRGIMHQEVPLPNKGAARGLQIFVNLPEDSQNDPAAAFPVSPEDIRTRQGKGWTSRTALDGTTLGHAQGALPSPVRIVEIAIDRGAQFDLDVPAGWGGILIALEGDINMPSVEIVQATQAIGFASSDGGVIPVSAHDTPARIAVIMGRQLHQPIHALGPLMLASAPALQQARAYVTTLSITPPNPPN